MTTRLETLRVTLEAALAGRLDTVVDKLGEITIEVAPGSLIEVATLLRDAPGLRGVSGTGGDIGSTEY